MYNLTKYELELADRLRVLKKQVFTVGEICQMLSIKKAKAYKIAESLVKKKYIIKLIRGKYACNFPFYSADAFEIASQIVWPSYISFWVMLNKYHLTEQVPYTIAVATTKKMKPIKLRESNIIFVTLKPELFFGYYAAGSATIAEKEKAIIDSIHLPRYSGGVNEVFECFCNAWPEINKEKLIKYAVGMNNASLEKRLGYMIESGGLKIEEELLKRLKINNSFSKLDPSLGKSKKYNKKWMLNINAELT